METRAVARRQELYALLGDLPPRDRPVWDKLTPPAGLDRIDRELQRVYRQAGVPERWALARYNTGHFETWDMRARIMRFLERYLVAAGEPEGS